MSFDGRDLYDSTENFLLHMEQIYPEEMKTHSKEYEVLNSVYNRHQNDRLSTCLKSEEVSILSSWMTNQRKRMKDEGLNKKDLELTQLLNWVLHDGGAIDESEYQVFEHMKLFHDCFYTKQYFDDIDGESVCYDFPGDYMRNNEFPDAPKYSLAALASIIPRTEDSHNQFYKATNRLAIHLLRENKLDADWRTAIKIARDVAKARLHNKWFWIEY